MKKVAIIGCGPGGYYAAVRLASAGLDVTLIDKQYAGGTCLNVGCIPTKVLLDHLSLYEHFIESSTKKKIFSVSDAKLNLENLRTFQSDVIKQLQDGLNKLFKKKKINFIHGEAKLLSEKKVQINSKEIIEADEIIIATGSKPRTIPGFQFDKKVIVSSDDIWNVPSLPQKLLVIGSGPIGIEFARIFNVLGSNVTVVEIQEKICPILDLEISENLIRSLKRRNITVKPNFASKLLEKKEKTALIEFISTSESKKENGEYDQVLIAVGRKPNADNLGLENVGVELEPQGFVKVNQYLQTNIKNIWAIGDVTNYPQLAHTASFQGRVVAENILGKKKAFQGDFIPSCIFGYPEIAFVGATEESLKLKNIEYKVGKFLFLASGKAKASGLTEGLVKILMDKVSKKVLGAHIIGPEASNLIHELVVAMQNNLTVDQITSSIHAHPTYSEVVLEALEDCLGEAVHV
ncbi:MAG: dihydrolipoyl dehydrogenase [Candidatus Melainabacteria bacterium]|nr:dihydrolipoyl dehydrogenase [Candidatus Melainabacteria bacterium]